MNCFVALQQVALQQEVGFGRRSLTPAAVRTDCGGSLGSGVLERNNRSEREYEHLSKRLLSMPFDPRKSGAHFEVVLDLLLLARTLGKSATGVSFWSMYLDTLLFVDRGEQPSQRTANAFAELVDAGEQAGMPKQIVDRIRLMHWVHQRCARGMRRLDELDASYATVVSALSKAEGLSAVEQRKLAEEVWAIRKAATRQGAAFQRIQCLACGGPLRTGRLRRVERTVRRVPRRAPRRRATPRRQQADSSGDGDDGPGEPPATATRLFVEACGLAPVRPGRPRDQASTARFGEQTSDTRRCLSCCGRGPYPEAARVAPRLRGAASEVPPVGGPVREADGGGA